MVMELVLTIKAPENAEVVDIRFLRKSLKTGNVLKQVQYVFSEFRLVQIDAVRIDDEVDDLMKFGI